MRSTPAAQRRNRHSHGRGYQFFFSCGWMNGFAVPARSGPSVGRLGQRGNSAMLGRLLRFSSEPASSLPILPPMNHPCEIRQAPTLIGRLLQKLAASGRKSSLSRAKARAMATHRLLCGRGGTRSGTGSYQSHSACIHDTAAWAPRRAVPGQQNTQAGSAEGKAESLNYISDASFTLNSRHGGRVGRCSPWPHKHPESNDEMHNRNPDSRRIQPPRLIPPTMTVSPLSDHKLPGTSLR
jgi:hypothetical protein